MGYTPDTIRKFLASLMELRTEPSDYRNNILPSLVMEGKGSNLLPSNMRNKEAEAVIGRIADLITSTPMPGNLGVMRGMGTGGRIPFRGREADEMLNSMFGKGASSEGIAVNRAMPEGTYKYRIDTKMGKAEPDLSYGSVMAPEVVNLPSAIVPSSHLFKIMKKVYPEDYGRFLEHGTYGLAGDVMQNPGRYLRRLREANPDVPEYVMLRNHLGKVLGDRRAKEIMDFFARYKYVRHLGGG